MTEDQLEQEVLQWFVSSGYTHVCGYDIAPDGPSPERADYVQPVLVERLRNAISRINPQVPLVAREDAIQTGTGFRHSFTVNCQPSFS